MKNSKTKLVLLCTWLAFSTLLPLSAEEEGSFGVGIQRCDGEDAKQTTLTFPSMVHLNEGMVNSMIISNKSRQQTTLNPIISPDWTLQRGHNYSLKADFRTVRPAAKVHLQLYLHLLPGRSSTTCDKQTSSAPIRLPFFRKNLCRTPGSGLQCPLATGGQYTFKLNVRIPEQTPAIEGRLRMQLLNERRLPLLCFVLPLRVVEGEKMIN